MKHDIHIYFKGIEEPELFENIDDFEPNKGGKFLFLYADCDTGVEWYIPLENLLYFQIDYKGK